ncbi:MAG: alpha/beta fold hydrolase [Actinobacteria bacterium]|nr:MAG: alpha/beta fold hydrolase [Actinomycetota bacterium]
MATKPDPQREAAAEQSGSQGSASDETPINGNGTAAAVGPEADLFARQDPLSLIPTMRRLGAALAGNPAAVWEASARLSGRLAASTAGMMARALGAKPQPALQPDLKDRRFKDPAWDENPVFFGERQAYLAWAHFVHELVTTAGLDRKDADKAAFGLGLLVDALAPTNFLLSNPTALRKAQETKGLSLLKGLRNFIDDALHNDGMPRQFDQHAYAVGRNLGMTPGKVVYRNDLMELIQYEPQTATTYAIPLLVSPPWINKYYLMDLAPGRSFIEWAVQHGHTTFAISYRNPDESMRDVSLDDYLIHGPASALDVIQDITGQPKVNMAGLCIGGTLTTMLLAYLAAGGEDRLNTATLLNTIVDFSEPGPLGCFTDAESIARLEQKMAKTGFLASADMERTFNALRANDLIWNYVASNWLMGNDPPAFDILTWNADNTRMPANMHSFYLRYCYQENQLARDEMRLAGRRLRLGKIDEDVYIVGAVEDHIAPWTTSYATTRLLGGTCRYVLTSSGHIAGIVNPPASKRRYWTNDELSDDPEEWRAAATVHEGSWWEDWTAWMAQRSGKRIKPPPTGSAEHPPIADAPGEYVHG